MPFTEDLFAIKGSVVNKLVLLGRCAIIICTSAVPSQQGELFTSDSIIITSLAVQPVHTAAINPRSDDLFLVLKFLQTYQIRFVFGLAGSGSSFPPLIIITFITLSTNWLQTTFRKLYTFSQIPVAEERCFNIQRLAHCDLIQLMQTDKLCLFRTAGSVCQGCGGRIRSMPLYRHSQELTGPQMESAL